MDSVEMESIIKECNFIIIVYVQKPTQAYVPMTAHDLRTNPTIQNQRHSVTQERNCKSFRPITSFPF